VTPMVAIAYAIVGGLLFACHKLEWADAPEEFGSAEAVAQPAE